MDIKVITRHAPSNYGSLLQSIATVKVIGQLGHKCEIIDYRREDESGFKMILTSLALKPEWNNNPLKKIIYILVRYPAELMASRKFARMRSRYLRMTQKYTTVEQLSGIESDVFMTGSDQVWGPTQNGKYDEAYFLSFVGPEAKKVAYASSFGRSNFEKEVLKEYKGLLSSYDSITVREDSAIEMLEGMNVSCLGHVLDPTLLLSGEDWDKYIDKEIDGKYVLVYQIHNDINLNEYAKKFAEKVNLPLLRVSPSLHQFSRGGDFKYLPDIGEFLAYIKNCTYLITDSFHGTVFALNYNKQFIDILPNNHTESRNLSILKLTGLEDRIVTDFDDFSIADRTIDYTSINKIIEDQRQKSIAILGTLCNK